MSSPEVFGFKAGINDHAFFGPGNKKLAIAQGNEIHIYEVSGLNKKLTQKLIGHDSLVTALDVSIEGLIASSSQDRTALVWRPQSDGTYLKEMVFLKINRSATCVKWSPNGSKFAVGSGSKIVSICNYRESDNWWFSKDLTKPFRSTILSIDWHPNNVLLAVGSTDSNVYVVSAYLKGVDEKPPASNWGSKLPFNTLCGTFTSFPGGWIHSVAFSPSGDAVAFASNDSTIAVGYANGENDLALVSVKTSYLPFTSLKFLSEIELVAAGHSCAPVVFSGDQESWFETRTIDNTKVTALPKKVRAVDEDDDDDATSGTSALSMFKQLDLRGKVASKNASELPTIHQNTITAVKIYDLGHISTSGKDGKVVIFPV